MTSSKRSFADSYAPLGQRAAAAAAAQDERPAAPVESAWQRWEMQSLGTPSRRPGAAARALQEAKAPAPPRTPPGPTLEDKLLARLRVDARAMGEAEGRRQGWSQGHAEGLEAGRTEGRAEGLALATAHAEQLRALAQGLPAALAGAERELSASLISLALDVARQVVHRSLEVEPGWIVPLVQQLLNTKPALQGEPRLLLHSDDVVLVRSSLGNALQEAGWQVRADDSISRGGCRVHCAGSDIDATLETRWERVTTALGGDTGGVHG
ncbi:MAG: flagellar assembly protein FliH [Proteobacteria bacterium]|nr:flagellar assembly protein FliH [Pseudomonadota bacterium]